MKTPKPRKLPSGSWNVHLRLGGESISITEPTEKEALRKAQLVKAEYLAGQREKAKPEASWPLSRVIDAYVADRTNSLSPETALKYKNIRDNHWKSVSKLPLSQITDRQWQQAVNAMLESYAAGTVSRSYGMIKTAAKSAGCKLPEVSIGGKSAEKAKEMDKCRFLEPEQIPTFVKAAAQTPYAIPLLLALSSLRISEIDGLNWSDVVTGSKSSDTFIVRIRRVRIKGADGKWIVKTGAKNEGSVRDVDVLIPELRDAIAAARKSGAEGKVMGCSQEGLRKAGKRICERTGLPFPGIHGLRHTFASLSAHLGIPEIVSQQIGGWSNDRVMKEIYTHAAASDIMRSKDKIRDFYAPKNPSDKIDETAQKAARQRNRKL